MKLYCISDSPQHFFHMNKFQFLSCLLAMCHIFTKMEGYVWDGLTKHIRRWGVALLRAEPWRDGHTLSIRNRLLHMHVSLMHTLTAKVHLIPSHHSSMYAYLWPDRRKGCWRGRTELGRRDWPIHHPGRRKQSQSKKQGPQNGRAFFSLRISSVKSCKNFSLPLRAANSGHAYRYLILKQNRHNRWLQRLIIQYCHQYVLFFKCGTVTLRWLWGQKKLKSWYHLLTMCVTLGKLFNLLESVFPSVKWHNNSTYS